MTFSIQPVEIKMQIIWYSAPISLNTNEPLDESGNLTRAKILKYGKEIRSFLLISREFISPDFKSLCKEKLSQLKRIYEIFIKYTHYQHEYANPSICLIENPSTGLITHKLIDPKGNPQLLDALFTGLDRPGAWSTFDVYDSTIEGDIIDILKFTPRSQNCILGRLRLLANVIPLAAACFNTKIPVRIIEKLLQNEEDANSTIIRIHSSVPLQVPLLDVWCSNYNTLSNSKDKDRANQIIALFYKRGYMGNVKKY